MSEHTRRQAPSASGYRCGCRCEDCRAAHYAAGNARVAALADLRVNSVAPPQAPHGTEGGYNYWSCRCDACRAASTAARKARGLVARQLQED